ncbi:AP2 domain protein [Cryptosporidium meleagridis]|uniref:AP2 domain protein n=1 Tax=Cryptosporidium meleagridis TaxID=93969 RepID=A0A2P4YYQ2_9CRYT|nr:AP2 domain protein [Cryptosporidium meleagridis]
MQHFYNGYLPSINCGTSSSSSSTSSFAASNRIANTGSSPNISLSNDLNPYLQQTLNKLPVALNPNLPYLQHSMIAFSNRIPYQTTPEVQNNNPNLTELLESIGSDFRLDQNKSNEEELINSGFNGGLSEEQLNSTDFTELSSSSSSTVSSSSMADAFPTSQSSSSLIQTIDEENLTGIIKTTISDSSVQKPLQTKRERVLRTNKNKLSGSSSHGGVGASSGSNSGGISAQDLDKAISLTNKGFRSLSLKGIYYDRRNHGWQVRIRKRQTEISRYFSAKRYGVEKSYEMALRFYQVNIIGNFGNESKSAKNSENSRRLDGKSDNQVSPILSNNGQNELFERQISGQKNFENQITDNGVPVNGTNIFKNISSNSRIYNNSIHGSFKPLDTDSVPLNGNLNNISFSSQGDLDVNNQLLSHYITNNILNNMLVNQIIANNLFANTMMNVRNAVNLQGTTGLPIHCFSKVPTPQPQAQYGTNFTACVNSPNIVPSVPIINPGIGIVSYNNDPQLMLKDLISNALTDSEGLWKGIYYDNRNKGWKLCLDGYAEKFFGSVEFGEVESLTLVLVCKLNVLKLNCDISQIRPTISNSIAVLQKVMAINNEASHESPLSEGKSFIDGEGKKTVKNLLDSTLREKMDSFSLTELTEFISVSQQVKQIINNGILNSGYQTLSSINFNEGIPFVQPMNVDNLKHSLNYRQPILNNFFDSSVFLQSVNNNQSLLYGQFLLNNQNQFGML